MLLTSIWVLALFIVVILGAALLCVFLELIVPKQLIEKVEIQKKKKYGIAAKEFVKAFSPVGTKVTLRTYERDKFGRWLADIKVGAKWLSKELLKNHHAVEYHGENKKAVAKGHLANRKLVKLSE
tara:strand:+ start:258 stop:632 length:375 start_codon:yes stop_codon:yes gene_type:complete